MPSVVIVACPPGSWFRGGRGRPRRAPCSASRTLPDEVHSSSERVHLVKGHRELRLDSSGLAALATDGRPRVVLIHGAGHNAAAWHGVMDHLEVPAIAVDLPGHGQSARPEGSLASLVPLLVRDLSTVAPALAVVAGHSIGAWVGLALRAAGVSGRVVGVEGGFRVEGHGSGTDELEGEIARRVLDFRGTPPQRDSLYQWLSCAAGPVIGPRYVAIIERGLASDSGELSYRPDVSTMSWMASEAWAVSAGVDAPDTVVWASGKGEQRFAGEVVGIEAARARGTRVLTTSGSRHDVPLHDPDLVVHAIHDAVRSA